MSSPPELRSLATEVAEAAGAMILERRRGDFAIDTKSAKGDFVTEVDKAAEEMIISAITAARPNDGFLGEEGADTIGSSGVRWIIDPIDGTTNFVYDIPGYCVSVAAELDGEVVAGAVVDPVHRETFSAHLGGGATRNGDPIGASAVQEVANMVVATGFSYLAERRRKQGEVLLGVIPEILDIRRIGAAATDLCAVACGRVDASYELALNPWDYAAGALIAQEAGAIVCDFAGNPASPDGVVAAPPAVMDAFLHLLQGAGAGT